MYEIKYEIKMGAAKTDAPPPENGQGVNAMLDDIEKNHKKHFWIMFLYRVKYTESEYDIQNNDLLYKIHQTCQNTFELLENVQKW